MRAVIPFKHENAKSRLSEILTENQRRKFAYEMLHDVISALVDSGIFQEIDVLNSSIHSIIHTDFHAGINVLVSDRGLNDALNEYLQRAAAHNVGEVLIIMADMPLVTKKHILELTGLPSDVVIAPGSGGGTNALLIRRPDRFHVDYYGTSFLDHLRIAKEAGLSVDIYDSFLMGTDIDKPDDLIDLLIHGHGKAVEYLRSIGLSVDNSTGRLNLDKMKK